LLKHNNESNLVLFPCFDSPTFGKRLSFLVIPAADIGSATVEFEVPNWCLDLVAASRQTYFTGE